MIEHRVEGESNCRQENKAVHHYKYIRRKRAMRYQFILQAAVVDDVYVTVLVD